MKSLKILSLVTTLSCLSACTNFFGEHAPIRNYENDYEYSKSVPVLITAPGADFSSVESSYPVPPDRPKFTTQPSLIPPGNPGAA
jgi:hypothetical protein